MPDRRGPSPWRTIAWALFGFAALEAVGLFVLCWTLANQVSPPVIEVGPEGARVVAPPFDRNNRTPKPEKQP